MQCRASPSVGSESASKRRGSIFGGRLLLTNASALALVEGVPEDACLSGLRMTGWLRASTLVFER